MVVAGTVEAPSLGILDGAGLGVDLVGCPLHEAPVAAALPGIFLASLGEAGFSTTTHAGLIAAGQQRAAIANRTAAPTHSVGSPSRADGQIRRARQISSPGQRRAHSAVR